MKVFVAATRQNDGKTIVSIGLIAAILNRMTKIGYIKPVGQHFVEVDDYKVDEDSLLMKKTFPIDCNLGDMSPITIPKGFTESYIMSPNREAIAKEIIEAYDRVSAGKDFTLIEGTGHAGVGSVIDMSNADVAKLLGAKVILVCAGGIGRPIDEVMLNKALFESIGVEILGVIVNKIQEDKFDKISPIVRKGLERKGVEVLGVMPFNPILSNPTMGQLLEEMGATLISGKPGLDTVVNHVIIGAMPPHEALDYFKEGTLLITPATREDLILAAISSFILGLKENASVSGIVLTGSESPNEKIMELLSKTDVPVISLKEDTFKVATKINSLMVKIRPGDTPKINAAEQLIDKYVDIDRIIEKLSA